MTRGPNEPWSFGDGSLVHIAASLRMRERLRPYVMDQMRIAHEEGIPPMRPLFVKTLERIPVFVREGTLAPVAEPGP